MNNRRPPQFLTRTVALCLAAAALCAISVAQAADSSFENMGRMLKANTALEEKLVVAKDYSGLMALYNRIETPDFTYTNLEGQTLNQEQTHRYEEAMFARFQSITRFSATLETVSTAKKYTRATVQEQLAGVLFDAQKKPLPFTQTSTIECFYIKQEDHWRLAHMQTLGYTETYGGVIYTARPAVAPKPWP